MIRLFTSGTHKGLHYTAHDIDSIYEKSKVKEQIPFVFGHPKNNLPIVGFIEGSKLVVFKEGEHQSIGFKKEDAEFSDESMNIIKKIKHNKISVRLREGEINHIGLVEKAAVEKNNEQDFGGDKMSGDFAGVDDFVDEEATEDHFLNKLKSIFKTNSNMSVEKTPIAVEAQDFAALRAENEALKKALEEKKANEEFAALKAENEALKKEKSERAYADFSEKIDTLGLAEGEAKEAKAMASAFVDMGKEKEALSLFTSLANRAKLGKGSILTAEKKSQDFSEEEKVENEIRTKFLS